MDDVYASVESNNKISMNCILAQDEDTVVVVLLKMILSFVLYKSQMFAR